MQPPPAEGTRINIEITDQSNFLRWGFRSLIAMCKNFRDIPSFWPRLTIEGSIIPFMADFFIALNDEIKNNERTRIHFERDLFQLQVTLKSDGGDLVVAMRVGRALRALNAYLSVPIGAQCHSACVVILASGANRTSYGSVGIHRPYFAALDHRETRAQVVARLNQLNGDLLTYFQEMGQPTSLLDAMRAVPPNRIRTLTDRELENFMLIGEDPSFQERRLALDAHQYGTTSAEMRRRQELAQRMCFPIARSNDESSWRRMDRCIAAIKYAITEQTLAARESRAQSVCAPMLRGRDPETLTVAELDRIRECRRNIMIGATR